MRIAFFGEDAFSVTVLDSLVKCGHSVLAAYCPVYNNIIYKRLEGYCGTNSICFKRLSDFTDSSFIKELKELDLDLIVVCHFQKILIKELIDIPKFGSINLHPSLLPLYRGMSPQHWPIINGDSETGVSIHFIDEGVDTGDIIIQEKVLIDNDTYVFDLQNRMKKVYATIVKDALKLIENQKKAFIKQSHLAGSYYGKLKKRECEINLEMSCLDAYNLIRAVSFPYYGARYNDLIVWKARVVDKDKIPNVEMIDKTLGLVEIKNEKYIQFKDGVLNIEKSEKYEK